MQHTQRENFNRIKEAINAGRHLEAFQMLCHLSQPWDDFGTQHKYITLFNKLNIKELPLNPIKIALTATSSIEHFVSVFRFWLANEGYDAEFFVSDFNTIDQTILNTDSGLYQFNPDIIWVFSNYRDVICDIPLGASSAQINKQLDQSMQRFQKLWSTFRKSSSAFILQNNADIPVERVFGNYEGTASWGRVNFLRQYNYLLSSHLPSAATIFDIDYLSSLVGKKTWFDDRYWLHSKNAFSLEACGIIAFKAAKLVNASQGRSKKCLVLDLDNTLWGGVIADDGLENIKLGAGSLGEAFVRFQQYILNLKKRGIILAVCSKNDEANAQLPFLKHPDMSLSLNDIALFVANWDNKADNLCYIAETLNIGLDSMVFVDDNPAEREQVRMNLPMVAVPEMPQDPARFVEMLDEQAYFETFSFTPEDQNRSDMYQLNMQRNEFQSQFNDLSQFLTDLKMEAHVGQFDEFHLPRIAQLINKSNQFHLTTTRYTEDEIKIMMADKETICHYFKLRDKFGDNGLIAVIILKNELDSSLLVDTWAMSCRVLSRGMEEFIHDEMVNLARQNGVQRIMGRYIPTPKNKLVSSLYKRLGYTLINKEECLTTWQLTIVDQETTQNKFIRKVEHHEYG